MTKTGVTAYDVTDRYDAEYFGDLADRYRRRNRFARVRMRNVFSMMPSVDDRTVIDLGCGMGTFTIESARRGARSVGLDMMPPALTTAARVAGEEGVLAKFVLADAAELPIRSGSADVVIAADLTEHLDEDTLGRVLRETKRVLRTGGQLVLYTPEGAHIFERLRARGILRDGDPSHIGIRTADELAQAVRSAGLVPAAVRFLPSHVPVWSLLERALARWVPMFRRRIGLTAYAEGT